MASRCQNEGKLALRCPSTNRLWGNMQERRRFGRSQVLASSGREIVRHVETSTHTCRRPRLAPWLYHRAPRSKGGASPTARSTLARSSQVRARLPSQTMGRAAESAVYPNTMRKTRTPRAVNRDRLTRLVRYSPGCEEIRPNRPIRPNSRSKRSTCGEEVCSHPAAVKPAWRPASPGVRLVRQWAFLRVYDTESFERSDTCSRSSWQQRSSERPCHSG